MLHLKHFIFYQEYYIYVYNLNTLYLNLYLLFMAMKWLWGKYK